MAEKTYTAWVYVEVEIDGDFHEIGGPEAIFKSQGLGEMAQLLNLKLVPGHAIDIEHEAKEIEPQYASE